jgi:hypothetical protein
MTSQTFPDTAPEAIPVATHGPVPTALTDLSAPRVRRPGRVRRAAAIAAVSAVALTAVGVTWQLRADDDAPVVPRRATEADLRLAAEWARRTEALASEPSGTSPRPASYTDLRLAAEWARRLEGR